MKVILVMCLNQSILQLYETIQNLQEKGSCWIIDQVIDHNINVSKYNLVAGSSYNQITESMSPSKKKFD